MQNITNIQTATTQPTRNLLPWVAVGESLGAAWPRKSTSGCACTPTAADTPPPDAVQITDTEHTQLPCAVLLLPSMYTQYHWVKSTQERIYSLLVSGV